MITYSNISLVHGLSICNLGLFTRGGVLLMMLHIEILMISIRNALLAKCFLPWTEQPFKIEDVDDASAYVATDRIPEEPNGKINSHTTTLESLIWKIILKNTFCQKNFWSSFIFDFILAINGFSWECRTEYWMIPNIISLWLTTNPKSKNQVFFISDFSSSMVLESQNEWNRSAAERNSTKIYRLLKVKAFGCCHP